jgi:hypothetical protein
MTDNKLPDFFPNGQVSRFSLHNNATRIATPTCPKLMPSIPSAPISRVGLQVWLKQNYHLRRIER